LPENWRQSEICIVINNKPQGSIAKHLSCDWLLHNKFITQFAGKRIFKISEHLAKLQAKWLTVSHVAFSHQRCRTGQISKITCVLWTKLSDSHSNSNSQINVSLLSRNIKLL